MRYTTTGHVISTLVWRGLTKEQYQNYPLNTRLLHDHFFPNGTFASQAQDYILVQIKKA